MQFFKKLHLCKVFIFIMNKLLTKHLFSIALFFLFWSAGAGLLMRYAQTFGLSGFEIGKWVQGHSHVAFLGWGFLGVMHLLNQKTKMIVQNWDIILYILMIFSLLGMMLMFPIYGYKLIPILFLVLFLLASYGVLIRFYKHLRKTEYAEKQWISSAIFYYFLSSLVVWIIPIIIIKIGKSELYYNLIYFYLHFLYNGFFTFALWGLLLQKLREQYNIQAIRSIKIFFLLMQMSAIPTYVLSLYWNPISDFIQFIGVLSASILFIAILILLFSLVKNTQIFEKNFTILLIIGIFGDKILMQFLSSFYSISTKAIALKPFFVVGYLHWFTIGFLTFSILYLSGLTKIKFGKTGFQLLVLGFFITEITLFYKGTAILMGWNENVLPYSGLFYGSLLMFVGIIFFFRHINRSIIH